MASTPSGPVTTINHTYESLNKSVLQGADFGYESESDRENREESVKPTRPFAGASSSGSTTADTSRRHSRKRILKIEKGRKATDRPPDGIKWSDEETTKMLECLLGAESVVFDSLRTNPKRAFMKVAERLFQGRRSWEAVKSRYERLRKTFSAIIKQESFTGGSGDPDNVESRTGAAQVHKEGESVFDLSPAALNKWHRIGWYMLFNDRWGNHPGLSQRTERWSGQLSDMEVVRIASDDSEPSDSLLIRPTKKVKLEASGVPESRQKRTTASPKPCLEMTCLQTNPAFLETTSNAKNSRLELLKQREQQELRSQEIRLVKERKEAELAEINAKVKTAREILATPDMPEDLKEAAKSVLLQYLT
ncbi:hypothetical protein L210DRAFT_875583 [Boletus edulis BED1]|uniref:Uncharacterized protein n=1 Tax=Boletus edulis BED1 TaxID=1328754 RepID=A0AAD4GE14_BOLED|nr:hypothetical protein L210DRAFT_875583 [Boletus edulis BED1]